jgi:putative acyl-CoA dehydrogenase
MSLSSNDPSKSLPPLTLSTHEVKNQPPPLVGYNLFTSDAALVEGLRREGGAFAEDEATAFGALMGSEETLALGFAANKNTPVLHTHDRFGQRRDEVEFHPSWHELMRLSMAHGIHNRPWRSPRPGAHVARAAMSVMASQVEAGHGCPITMTFGVVPSIRMQPDLAAAWEPLLMGTKYDPRFIPAHQKSAVLFGMAMTEKQGGSDVRANATRAVPLGPGGPGADYALTGHKWFCSAPMCDAFLVLAQAPRGLSCFLLPRFLPDGTKNRFFLQRLKDKLGNRSNASSEIELDGAWARMVGEEGRGVPTIIEMANHTRLDCVIGSTALMRQAVAQATHHAAHRAAFGRKLIDHALMKNVLADLSLEAEAAMALMMRLARAYDEDHGSGAEAKGRPLRRIMTAVAKFWVTKRAVLMIPEALECLGGNGYVEESILPRLYREAPVNSVWEGSGNVMCLDVLRAMAKEAGALEGLLGEIKQGAGADRRLDAFVKRLEDDLRKIDELEVGARRVVEKMALALEGSLLVRHAPPAVADAFCASRLAEASSLTFGALPASVDFNALIDRALPKTRS